MTIEAAACLGPPVLASRDRIVSHCRAGLWGRSPLPGIFYRHVAAHPDRPALADWPAQAGEPRQMTYGEADIALRRLAARFSGFGLTPGDIVAVQLPPCVEAPLAMLACLGFGFIVCPLPMSWRRLEIEQALALVGARAIVTWSDDDGYGRDRVLAACAAAFRVSSIRFVFAFGANPPDGVTPLERALDTAAGQPISREGFPLELDANALALVTWDLVGPSGPRALARSHNEWIAAGASMMFEAQLADGATILSPFGLSGLAGIAGALVPWLMTGGLLALHRPFDLDLWHQQIRLHEPDLAIVPTSLASPLAPTASEVPFPRALGLIGAASDAIPRGLPDRIRLVALDALGEIAMVARRPDSADGNVLPIGPVRAGGSQGPVVFECRIAGGNGSPSGEIAVRGAPAPSAILTGGPIGGFRPTTADDGFVATGVWAAPADGGASRARPVPPPTAIVRHGSAAVSLHELDRLYGSLASVSDAAAIAVDDPVMGRRLVAAIVPRPGRSISLEDMNAHLAHEGAALYKYPDRIILLDCLPRGSDGVIERDLVLSARQGDPALHLS